MESIRDESTDVTPIKLQRTEILQKSPSYLPVHRRIHVPTELKGEESTDFALMESLPTEILQKILSCLPFNDRIRVERVCKRWKNVSTERVWRDLQELYIIRPKKTVDKCQGLQSHLNSSKFGNSITIKDNKLYLHDDRLEIIQSVLSRAGQYVKKLFVNFKIDDQPTLSMIAAHCHNIESIQVERIDNSNVEDFLRLLEVNQRLHTIKCCDADNFMERLPLRDWKSLSLGGLGRNPGSKMEQKLVALIENSPSIESFRINCWSPNVLTALSKCEELKDLSFPRWWAVEKHERMMKTSLLNGLTRLHIGFLVASQIQITNLLHRCINLESLSLSYLIGEFPLQVEQAVLALPKLESLELNGASVNDEILSRLLKFKHLAIMGSVRITDNGIFEMIKNSECLEQLDIPTTDVSVDFYGNQRKFEDEY